MDNKKYMVEVKLEGYKERILARVSGKLKMQIVKLISGGAVQLVMSPYDLSKRKIVNRILKK